MGKPKVILADTDEKYLAPLEMKFLDELNDRIDLEIITDKKYYEKYFSYSQKADVLLVSEELYSHDLQKQNSILNIFVLTEHHDRSATYDSGVINIFKYTSIKEIYNQIMAISQVETVAQKAKETTVILVYSPSGGVGKTTLALGMCSYFTQSYKKTLYVNAERINTFQHRMRNRAVISNDAVAELSNVNEDMFGRIRHAVRTEKFDYLPPFGAALSSINLDFSMYEELVKSAKGTKEYDIIVIDTDSVFDSAKASLIALANRVILVLDQSGSSVFSMNVLMKNMSCNDSEKYHFVCNKYDDEKASALDEMGAKPKFTVNEYVEYMEDIGSMTVAELASKSDIQKISLLVS